jgi:hypothetical protein
VPILRFPQALGQCRKCIPTRQPFTIVATGKFTLTVERKVVGPGNTVATSDRAPLITREIVVQICPWMFRLARHPSQATIMSYRAFCKCEQEWLNLLVIYCPANINLEQAKAMSMV